MATAKRRRKKPHRYAALRQKDTFEIQSLTYNIRMFPSQMDSIEGERMKYNKKHGTRMLMSHFVHHLIKTGRDELFPN